MKLTPFQDKSARTLSGTLLFDDQVYEILEYGLPEGWSIIVENISEIDGLKIQLRGPLHPKQLEFRSKTWSTRVRLFIAHSDESFSNGGIIIRDCRAQNIVATTTTISRPIVQSRL